VSTITNELPNLRQLIGYAGLFAIAMKREPEGISELADFLERERALGRFADDPAVKHVKGLTGNKEAEAALKRGLDKFLDGLDRLVAADRNLSRARADKLLREAVATEEDDFEAIAMLTPEQVRNIRLRLEDLELAFETIAGETPTRRAAAERRGWKAVDAADAFDLDHEAQAVMEATLDEDVAARYAA
jgi:hypothetical protein